MPGLTPIFNSERWAAVTSQAAVGGPRTEKTGHDPFATGLWARLEEKTSNRLHGDARQAQAELFETAVTTLAQVCPALIFLENATALDEASASLLRFILRSGQLPLLIIAACRDDEGAIAWLNAFLPHEKKIMALPPLPETAVRDYLDHLLEGPVMDNVVKMVQQRSHGNPLYVEEITRHLVDTGHFFQGANGAWQSKTEEQGEGLPPSLANLLARRLEKLSQKSREALAIAAVIGPEFDFDLWLALLGGDGQLALALDVLDDGLGRRLLCDAGQDRYRFQPLDMAAVLEGTLSGTRRRYFHRQVAETLIETAGSPAQIAHHYEAAGLPVEASGYMATAATKAVAANSVNEAMTYYRQAVKLAPSVAGYEAPGHLYRQTGQWAKAIVVFRQALALIPEEEEKPQVKAHHLNNLAFVLWLSDHYQEAYKTAAAVLKLKNVTIGERAVAQSHLGMIAWLLGRLAEAELQCGQSVEALRQMDDPASLAAAYSRLGLVYLAQANYQQAQLIFEQALAIRRQLGDLWGQAYCLNNLGRVAAEQGQFEQAQAQAAAAQLLFSKIDSQDGLMVVYAEQGRALLRQKRTAEALPLLTKALRLAQAIKKRTAYGLSDIYLLLAEAGLQRGELERARAAAAEGLKLVEAAGNREYIALGWAILARIDAAQGAAEQAAETYRKAIHLFQEVGSPAGLLRTQLAYAQFLAAQGQPERAAALEKEVYGLAARLNIYLNSYGIS